MKTIYSIVASAACAMLAMVAAPAAAQSSQTNIQQEVRNCDSGQMMGCLNAARHYEKIEDQASPTRTMDYSKRACDSGSTFGCRLYSLTTYRAALLTHQRVISTLLEGDPKGEWRTKGDLNMGIEQARAYYKAVQAVDPDRNEDWDGLYKELDGLMQ